MIGQMSVIYAEIQWKPSCNFHSVDYGRSTSVIPTKSGYGRSRRVRLSRTMAAQRMVTENVVCVQGDLKKRQRSTSGSFVSCVIMTANVTFVCTSDYGRQVMLTQGGLVMIFLIVHVVSGIIPLQLGLSLTRANS
jgi:hypothetical protein